MAIYFSQISRCLNYHAPMCRPHRLIHCSCRRWKKISCNLICWQRHQVQNVPPRINLKFCGQRQYSVFTGQSNADMLRKRISFSGTQSDSLESTSNVVPVGILIPEAKDGKQLKIVIVPMDLANQDVESLRNMLEALNQLRKHANEIDAFTNSMIAGMKEERLAEAEEGQSDVEQKVQFFEGYVQGIEVGAKDKAVSNDAVAAETAQAEAKETSDVAAATATAESNASKDHSSNATTAASDSTLDATNKIKATAAMPEPAIAPDADVAPMVPSTPYQPSIPSAPVQPPVVPVPSPVTMPHTAPNVTPLGDPKESQISASAAKPEIDELAIDQQMSHISMEVPEHLGRRLNDMAIASMHLSFEMDMTNIRDVILNGEQLDAVEPSLGKEAMVFLETKVEADPDSMAMHTVPLRFNALIKGLVQIDADKLDPKHLSDENLPEYNDMVTSIAANICSTALQRGISADNNNAKEMRQLYGSDSSVSTGESTSAVASPMEETLPVQKLQGPLAMSAAAQPKIKEQTIIGPQSYPQQKAINTTEITAKDGGAKDKKDPCAKDKGGKDGDKKKPGAKDKKGGKGDKKDGKGGDKKDPCAKFKKDGKGDKKDGKGDKKDGKGGDKKDPCAKFKKDGKGDKKDGKGDKKDGKGGDKKDPCAKFKKDGKGDKKDGKGDNKVAKGGDKKDPSAKAKKGAKGGDKNKDPCAKNKKGTKDDKKGKSGKSNKSGKSGKGGKDKKDPCAKFRKGAAGKDKGSKKEKKDPCKKKYSSFASPVSKFYHSNSSQFSYPHNKRHVSSKKAFSDFLKIEPSKAKISTSRSYHIRRPAKYTIYSNLVRRRFGAMPLSVQLNNWAMRSREERAKIIRTYSEGKKSKCDAIQSKKNPKARKNKKPRDGLRTDCFQSSSSSSKECPKKNKSSKKRKLPAGSMSGTKGSSKSNSEERCKLLTIGSSTANQCRMNSSVAFEKKAMQEDSEQQTKEMIRIPAPYQITRELQRIPEVKPFDVLIRTGSVALTGSDIHVFENANNDLEDMTLGHDATGFVEELGRCVKHLQVGDRVVMESALSCGICDNCKRGLYNICADLVYNGFLATHQSHPADLCHRLPDSISMEEGTLTQTLAMGCQACFKAHISPTSNVLIIGSTPTAVASAMCATAIGARRVTIAGTMLSSLQVIDKSFGFNTVYFDSNTLFGEVLMEIYNKFHEWPNCAINCAISPMSMNLAVMALQPSSACVLAECEMECASFNALDILMKNIRLIPSFRSANMYPTAIQLMKSGRAPMHKLIAKTFTWTLLEEAFWSAQHESNFGLKKVIVNNAEEGGMLKNNKN